MRKKLLLLALAFCMSASMVACGNGENGNKGESTTETVIEQETNNESENSKAPDTKTEKEDESKEQSSTKESQISNENLLVEDDYTSLQESQGFEFESNGDGTCTLKKIGSCSDKDIVIPEKSPEGDIVTIIGEYAFYGAEDIDSIVISGKTMELDKNAFQSCEAKKIVIIGSDLEVGNNAFSYCDDISEIYISNSEIDIKTYAFYGAGKDMGVTIVNCNGILDDQAFQTSEVVDLTISGCTLEIGENAFSYCEDLATVYMDNSTLEIGTYAFYDAGDDTDISFLNCSLEVDDKAFQCCGAVTLNISGSETVLGENTFSYCEDLTDVFIGANNIEIGTYSFYDCSSLVNVSIASDSEDDALNLIIKDKAFQCSTVQDVVIGRGNVEIEENAFSYCKELMNVEIKGVLTDVGKYAFYDCPDELIINYDGSSYNKDNIMNAK